MRLDPARLGEMRTVAEAGEPIRPEDALALIAALEHAGDRAGALEDAARWAEREAEAPDPTVATLGGTAAKRWVLREFAARLRRTG